ncbi:MAG TPA: bifunctional phosphopantothenoylcysteine decarboxylase/phosphopantothenate--cysteine ligase CoaBC [bacterium]|nr:bifunctional phosphopantothenoylcysteine decarboxylase/phosphopantothenate--cysteine ligase CoaBC [bacterium]
MPKAPSILVGVAGGIAAYKAADVVSALRKRGAQVTVLMTRNAGRFVAPLTLKTLSGRPVGEDLFAEPAEWGVGHVTLAKEADAFVVVAATADLLAKLALGLADDFVSTAALVYHPKPLLLAPAMNTAMLRHPAVRANLRALQSRGARVLDPSSGLLACGDVGDGKLVDAAVIADEAWSMATAALAKGAGPRGRLPLAGRNVLVSAGPTREAVDPVRFLSNPSSGKMGYAIAEACRDLGARVTLVSGPVALPDPQGLSVVRVTSALEMLAACRAAFKSAHAFVACAAVSDYRPAEPAAQKLKKTGRAEVLRLEPNPDILLTLSKSKGRRVLVGFAAETEQLLEQGAKKLSAKKLDLLVANPVSKGRGFGADANEAWLLRPSAPPEHLPLQAKTDLAQRLASELAGLLAKRA